MWIRSESRRMKLSTISSICKDICKFTERFRKRLKFVITYLLIEVADLNGDSRRPVSDVTNIEKTYHEFSPNFN
jgi:hypothetical protein